MAIKFEDVASVTKIRTSIPATVTKNRGRPPSGKAMTPAEKQQAFRKRKKERGPPPIKVDGLPYPPTGV